MVASRRGNIDAISVLLHTGADPNIVDGDGHTMLHYAVNGGCIKNFLQVIVESRVDVNVRNKGVLTALMRACRTGNRAEISALLQVVADPIIVDGNSATLLHYAVVWDCSNEVLQAMVESGVAVNVRNRNGITALMKACRRGNIDVMSVLLHAGVDPNIVDGNGATLLHCAVVWDCSNEVVQAIVESGIAVNVRNKEGGSNSINEREIEMP